MMRVALIALVVGGLSTGITVAGPRPMTAGALPTTSAEIAVVHEDLTIRVIGNEARVDARLRLRNLGAATAKTLVGFPCERGLELGVLALDCKSKIAVKVGGKPVRAAQKNKHWVWWLPLTSRAETDLEVSYRARLPDDKNPMAGLLLHYRLTTGAAWAGPIAELDVRVELPTEAVMSIAPAGYKREPGVIEWKLRDNEPTRDLAILVNPFYSGRYLSAVKSSSDRRATELRKLAIDMKRDPARLVKTTSTLLHALGTGLGLPAASADEIAATAAESIRMIETAAGP